MKKLNKIIALLMSTALVFVIHVVCTKSAGEDA